MLKERREFPRADVKYKINIICEGSVILGVPQDYTFHTYTENIGLGGIKVVLEKEVKAGTLLKLELYIRSEETFPVVCKGMVVWVNKINPGKTKPDLFAVGIKFLDLCGSMESQLISDIVNSYLSRTRKSK